MASSSSRTLSTDETTADETVQLVDGRDNSRRTRQQPDERRPDQRIIQTVQLVEREATPDDLLALSDELSDDPTLTWYHTMLCTLDSPDKAFKELSEMLLQDPWSHGNADLIERRSGPQVWFVTCLSLPTNHTAVHTLSSPSQSDS